MGEQKVRVGIVGCGGIGGLGARDNSHAGGYRACEEADLIAAADMNPDRLTQFCDEWDIPIENRFSTDISHVTRTKRWVLYSWLVLFPR